MGRARSMRPRAIIRPLWSTTTAVTAMSICAAWACALRTIWIAFSPGIAIAFSRLPPTHNPTPCQPSAVRPCGRALRRALGRPQRQSHRLFYSETTWDEAVCIGEQKPSLGLEQEGSGMSVPREIGHIVLNVTDVERSTRFYRDVVGFQVSRYRPDGTGAFLTCGVVHHNLALFKAPAGARPPGK